MAHIDEYGRVVRGTSNSTEQIRNIVRDNSNPHGSGTYGGNTDTYNGGIVAGFVFAILALVAIVVGFAFSGIDSFNTILQYPNTLFWGAGWVYWVAAGLAIVISTIVVMAKDDFPCGVCTFFATSLANIAGFAVAFLISSLLMPAIAGWRVSGGSGSGFLGINVFNLGGAIRGILLASPQIIIIAVLLASVIFVIVRYINVELFPEDILWSFLCALIVAVAIIAAICAVIALVWVLLSLLLAALAIVAIVIGFICWASGCG